MSHHGTSPSASDTPVVSLADAWRILTWTYGPLMVLILFVNPSWTGLLLSVVLVPLWLYTTARRLRLPVVNLRHLGWRAALIELIEKIERHRRIRPIAGQWITACQRTGLTDRDEQPIAVIADMRDREWGVDILLMVTADADLARLQDRAGALARWCHFHEMRFRRDGSGRVLATGYWQDPLAGVREVTDQRGQDWPITVGRLDSGEQATVDLTDAAHVAIQGATRSGKSVLTYALLGQLAGRDDVMVCGVDPTGITLGPWTKREDSGPIAIGGTGEDNDVELDRYVAVVEALIVEMKARAKFMNAHGQDKISTFSKRMPLIVAVFEEYPSTRAALEAGDVGRGTAKTAPGPKREPSFTGCLGMLLREGAKYGIRVLILAQRMDAKIVGGAERSQLGLRITLRIDNADGVRMLHEQADPDLIVQAPEFSPGQGIYQVPGQPLRIAQFDLIDYPTYRQMIEPR